MSYLVKNRGDNKRRVVNNNRVIRRDKMSYYKKLATIDVLLETVIDAVRDNCVPDDVFTENELSEWALDNGYTKED